ncbi:MAG: Hsp20/alpha crystallin family protein [Methylococcales bacterium]|nr:Hsp20/alpha crystallin family protein [Methylococcales bacterium]
MANRNIGWSVMAVEVFDDNDRVVVRREAPGMDKKEFDLQVIDDVLIIKGEKRIHRIHKEHTEGYYHVKECAYGRFERAIELPDKVDSDKAQADYENGV